MLSLLLATAAGVAVFSRHGQTYAASPGDSQLVPTQGNIRPDLPKRVLVVYNAASDDSLALAKEYMDRRSIPEENRIGVVAPLTDECKRSDYEANILPAVRERLFQSPDIEYVVLMRGIPFRFTDWGDSGGLSIDSALATCILLPAITSPRLPSPGPPPDTRVDNPYFRASERFDRKRFGGMVLVCRLDGPTNDDAIRPVLTGLAAHPVRGPFYLRDSFCLSMAPGNAVLLHRGFETEYVTPANNPLQPLYQGEGGPYMAHWGAGPHDTQYSREKFAAMKFLPGALCDLTWSTSAAGLRDPHAEAGINQLTSYQGVAGAHGFVSEPYCESVSRCEVVLDRYTRGYNLAESFYMGTPYLHWKDVVLGDPLCAPYADGKAPPTPH